MSLFPHVSHQERVKRRRNAIQSFKAKADAKRSVSDKVTDYFTSFFGSITFLTGNMLFFAIWLLWNTGMIPTLRVFDPFPFGLLTTMVSLEAIFLAIVVLISQNRATRVADLREEVELYINTYAESEITKIMYLQTLLLEKNGVDLSADKDLQKMLQNLKSDAIEAELEKQL